MIRLNLISKHSWDPILVLKNTNFFLTVCFDISKSGALWCIANSSCSILFFFFLGGVDNIYFIKKHDVMYKKNGYDCVPA